MRLAAGLDDAVAQALSGVADPFDLTSSASVAIRVERERAAIGAWYEFFPRSEGGLGRGDRHGSTPSRRWASTWCTCRPSTRSARPTARVGTTRSPRGRSDPGSPWAIGSPDGGHTAVDPSLGTLADFDRFVARAASSASRSRSTTRCSARPTIRGSPSIPSGSTTCPTARIRYAENPPKKYQDIHPIDFWPAETHRAALWEACREILEFWIGHGVRIFRVDNPHTKPVAFWEWLSAEVVGRPPRRGVPVGGVHPPGDDAQARPRSASARATRTSPGARTAAELRDYVIELAEGDRPRRGSGRTSGPTRPTSSRARFATARAPHFEARAVLAALLSPSWGVYSGFELCENEPASSAERGVPRLREVPHHRAGLVRPGIARPVAHPAQRDPADATPP